MTELLPAWPLLSAFLVASLILAVTPGPAVLYIVARSAAQGRRAGLVSVVGIALGNLGNACAAVLGLAALFSISSFAFTLAKYAGAAYLIWLGVQMLRDTRGSAMPAQPKAAPPGRVFRDGFVVALLNPKTTLFFAAFLPQFIDSAVAPMTQSLLLGAFFVTIAAVTDSSYAYAAGAVAPRLRGECMRRIGQWSGGATFVGLGLLAAFSEVRPAK